MVELFKNPALGISITGGINGENLWRPGDPGLYVYDLAEGKPAQLSGQIEIGDKIISVSQDNILCGITLYMSNLALLLANCTASVQWANSP